MTGTSSQVWSTRRSTHLAMSALTRLFQKNSCPNLVGLPKRAQLNQAWASPSGAAAAAEQQATKERDGTERQRARRDDGVAAQNPVRVADRAPRQGLDADGVAAESVGEGIAVL
mgnify:CR=1 FL=1